MIWSLIEIYMMVDGWRMIFVKFKDPSEVINQYIMFCVFYFDNLIISAK